jgi:hypothetical protein
MADLDADPRLHVSIETINQRAARASPHPGQRYTDRPADVAQLVEHFTRNEGVPGSSPGVGSLALQELWPQSLARAARPATARSRTVAR